MNTKEKEQLKIKIEEKIYQTEQEVTELEELTRPISPENSIGRISRMDAINNKSVAEAALRTTRKKLTSLKFAHSKIDSPDFGLCTVCKTPIPTARLLYMPESTRCVRCADR
jgi:DnaK suppressor protein